MLQYLDNYPAEDIYASGQCVNVVLKHIEDAENLSAYIHQSGIAVNECKFVKPAIEDCFIQLMRNT